MRKTVLGTASAGLALWLLTSPQAGVLVTWLVLAVAVP